MMMRSNWMPVIVGGLLGLASADAANLTFDQLKKEVHAPADAKLVVQEFEFKNTTDKVVEIKRYDAACSCMAAEVQDGKLKYAPGETGVIRAKFDIGNFYGQQDKVISLWLDDDKKDHPSVELTTHVVIPELIKFEPKTLKWQVGDGGAMQKIKIAIDYQKPIKITNVTTGSSQFSYRLVTIQEGKEYELEVTPKDVSQPGLGIFRVETDCKIDRFKVVQMFAQVRKPEK